MPCPAGRGLQGWQCSLRRWAVALALGIKLIGGAKAAIISVFEPIEAILLGVLLFHERLTLRGTVGIALVMGAIVLVNYTQTKNVAE